jgi:CBS domain containing-hemolysin-like protein
MRPGLLLLSLGLLLLNGFFVGAEFALIAARRSRLEKLAEAGSARARVALRSATELSFTLAGAQLGITMASLGLGAVAEPAIADTLVQLTKPIAEIPHAALHSIAFVVALAIVVFLHMVVGEMAPKNVAIAEPEKTALIVAFPFRLFTNLLRPFIALLNLLARAGLKLFGVEQRDELQAAHSPGEIGMMISEAAKGGMIDPIEHRLLRGAVAFSERDAASVMVPRTDIVAAPLDVTPAELEKLVIETGHSRIPLYTENLDHIVGFFHIKDLLKVPDDRRDKPLSRRFIRQMLVVPESLKLHPLLLAMRRQRRHFALVVDEHGGTAGVVTLEDLLEELVGEIRDEHDVGELGIIVLGEGRYRVPGTLRIDEIETRIGADLPEGEYETVAGFLMDRLGRIPEPDDVVAHDGWTLRVASMQGRRVEQVIVEKTGPGEDLPGGKS